MDLGQSFESFKMWVLEHLPINAADSEGLGPNGTLSKKWRKKRVAILMCLCRCRDNHHFISWLFKPWEAWDKYIPSPAPSFHQQDETVWVILLPLALISEEQYCWELNVPTFQKRVRSISCLLRKKKEKKGKNMELRCGYFFTQCCHIEFVRLTMWLLHE